MSRTRSRVISVRVLSIGGVLMLVFGGVAGYLATPAPHVAKTAESAQKWALPPVASMLGNDSAALDPLLRHSPFGTDATGAKNSTDSSSSGAGSTEVQLVGIVDDRGLTALFYSESKRYVLRLKQGDELPSYGRLTNIDHGKVTIELNGCQRSLQLFANETPIIHHCASLSTSKLHTKQVNGNQR
jgi:hypothetical protein